MEKMSKFRPDSTLTESGVYYNSTSSILFTLIIGIFIFALILLLRKRSSGKRTFMLSGICDSGKTTIFMQLAYGKLSNTFTSVQENVGTYHAGRRCADVVDIPGHYRVRDKFLNQYKGHARGLVFVVDSSTIHKNIQDVADALYTLLTDRASLPCSMLVLCNKQDHSLAKGAKVIKALLENELEIVRGTRSRKLQSVDDDSENLPVQLGRQGKPFKFEHISQDIQFAESSAKNHDLLQLTEWLEHKL